MRRRDREITDVNRINEIIDACTVLRIGLVDDGQAYIVPVNFGYDGEAFYFHGAAAGRKVDLIKADGKCGFELDTNHSLLTEELACDFTYYYASVIGNGSIEILDDDEAKAKALQVIMHHFSGKSDWYFDANVLKRTAVFKLTVDNMTCKENAPAK